MFVTKRDNSREEFKVEKIENAILKAFKACNISVGLKDKKDITNFCEKLGEVGEDTTVESIQDQVEKYLCKRWFPVGKAYMLYREQHKMERFIEERLDYMDSYSETADNAATASETDPNSNVSQKNVATLDPEVYKITNRNVQRRRMKRQLKKDFPNEDIYKRYIDLLEHHFIYIGDEASTPTIKFYCQADDLYPLMTDGIGALDGGKTEGAPTNIASFSGQLVNFIHAASGQCKGAVAVPSYLLTLNYYIIKEFGPKWYEKLDVTITNEHCLTQQTIWNKIRGAFKTFVYGVNQMAGNRGGQSPFTNISYFDHTYFNGMFESFCYPDGSKPEWEAIDKLQRLFMNWFNERRLKSVLTFPVETFCMVYDDKDFIDKEYKELCAEMYAKGHSFFTYISDSVDSLASCCRLRNKLQKNTFSPTSGMTGLKTGSCNVITLNLNRIVQQFFKDNKVHPEDIRDLWNNSPEDYQEKLHSELKKYLINTLEVVYKAHISFKHLLYREEDRGMYSVSNGGYIHMKDLYSTIGINGHNEAARFLGLEVSWNKSYVEFLQFILSIIKEQNELHSIEDKKYPIRFNSEVIPAESVGGKNYRWDAADGYWVPSDENLYNSYFYNAHDNTSVLDKFRLHGKATYQYTDGGSALHCNLEDHLSKEQYLKLLDFARENGTQYFTFNIPNSECDDCHFITKHPIDKCPKCGSEHITQYSRVIGYLVATKSWGMDRQIEGAKRTYSNGKEELKEWQKEKQKDL
jgi:ribonucleoside-triphosphate reductase